MRASERVFCVDANMILRYVLRDDAQQYMKALTIFEAMTKGEITLLCDPVILSEVVWTSESFYKIERQTIASGLEPLLKSESFVMSNKGRYIEALRLYGSSVPHFGDACACAAALEQSNGKLLSFDRKLSKIQGISRMEAIDE